MGLATIYLHSLKEHTKIHKIPKFGVHRSNNEQDTTICKGQNFTEQCMACRTLRDTCLASHTFLCKILTFLNGCILITIGSIYTKLGDFVNLGVFFQTMWINSC